ncbi:MAG: MBOAT family protein [Alphaproteobacteria bacterium]|nr:MBOAT family protein [Alphaproteobacteria bacterium]
MYYLIRRELRNVFLLLASIFFYAWGEPKYLPVIFTTITISYIGALTIERFSHKRILLALFVLLDLSFLFYFKYTNFFLENLNLIFHQKWSLKVVLPLGISFYTFQALSYLVDVYRGQVKAQKNYLKIALYICLFPQLIAGPIVKYHDVSDQIDNREETIDKVYYGIRRFIIGLAKKVLIANTLGGIADKVFRTLTEEGSIDVVTAWLGGISRALQVYYDFSGYSDMAIGLGAVFGFKFLENFNYPYISKTMSEYWQRWHISLATWCKDYIYIPMGGSRVVPWRIYFNIFFLFFVIGLWHGASWNFVVFGVLNGLLVMTERFFGLPKKIFKKMWIVPQYLYVFIIFIINAILANTDTMKHSLMQVRGMFGLFKNTDAFYPLSYYIDRAGCIIFAVALLCCAPIFKNMLDWGKKWKITLIGVDVWLFVLLFLSCMQLAVTTYNPFIYFRF